MHQLPPPRGPQSPQFANAGPPRMMNPPHLPQGLDILLGTDRIVVKQEVEPLEVFKGIETPNRYQIFNGFGAPILYAFESTPPNLLKEGKERPFTVVVLNPLSQHVMLVIRGPKTNGRRQVFVQVPPGNYVARISDDWHWCSGTDFNIFDVMGGLLFQVKCPSSAGISKMSEFDVLSGNRVTQVAKITKQWGDFLQHQPTGDADTFGVFVPAGMDVLWKAVLIAATFVVDFEFYEDYHKPDS